jgi:hypothetical protein
MSRLRLLAFLTLGGIACFIVTIGALHWLQPNLSPLNEAMSYYVHGAAGWLLTLGLLGLGLGSLALTLGLWRAPGVTTGKGGRWCLGVWSMGALLGAIFAADPPGQWDKPPSVSGSIHGGAAMIALVVFPIAAILLSRSLRSDVCWARLSGPLVILARASAAAWVVFMLSLAPVFVRPGPPILLGLTERVLFLAYIAWLAVAAVGLLQVPGSTHAEGRGRPVRRVAHPD